MDFEFEWLIENQVCKVVLPQEVTQDILEAYDQLLINVLDQAANKIHMVADLRIIKTMPNLNQARKMRHPRHPHMGRVLMVGLNLNPIARFMASLVAQAAGVAYKAFDTYEEVFAYLEKMEGIHVSS